MVRFVAGFGRGTAGSVGERPAAWGVTDPAVVVAASGGCERSFLVLYATMNDRVRRTARRILRDDHAAEDLVQETFVAVLQRLPNLKEPAAFEPWVLRITRNLAIDSMRRRTRCSPAPCAHEEEPAAEAGTPAVIARWGTRELSPAAVAAVRLALEALHPDVRETLRLKYGCGLSCQAIARRTGTTLGAVKTRLHRGRRDVARAVLGTPR